jgi:hypothetical protein
MNQPTTTNITQQEPNNNYKIQHGKIQVPMHRYSTARTNKRMSNLAQQVPNNYCQMYHSKNQPTTSRYGTARTNPTTSKYCTARTKQPLSGLYCITGRTFLPMPDIAQQEPVNNCQILHSKNQPATVRYYIARTNRPLTDVTQHKSTTPARYTVAQQEPTNHCPI